MYMFDGQLVIPNNVCEHILCCLIEQDKPSVIIYYADIQ
jgi:hypothetical protein